MWCHFLDAIELRYIDEIKHKKSGAIWDLKDMVRFNMVSIMSYRYVEYNYYQ